MKYIFTIFICFVFFPKLAISITEYYKCSQASQEFRVDDPVIGFSKVFAREIGGSNYTKWKNNPKVTKDSFSVSGNIQTVRCGKCPMIYKVDRFKSNPRNNWHDSFIIADGDCRMLIEDSCKNFKKKEIVKYQQCLQTDKIK